MTTPILTKRLATLEAARASSPSPLTLEERAEAARRYEAAIHAPEESDPRAVGYWTAATVHQLAADYDVMLKGAQAPWERSP